MSRLLDAVVRPGDVVCATGRNDLDGSTVTLAAAGTGHYDYVLQQAAQVRVPTDLSRDNASPEIVTVRGIWTGEALTEAEVVDRFAPVALPENLGDRADPAIIPAGRRSRQAIVDADLLAALDDLRETTLLSYVGHRTASGWIGVASATDRRPVDAILRPRLDDAYSVVHTEWSPRDLDAIDEVFSPDGLESEILEIGRFIDPAGRLKGCALVRLVTPQMAAALARFSPDALVLTSWMQRASRSDHT